ncbi:MAG: nucleotidyltransferase domain-containing protein [Bacteroidales bacterium]|nr:nucleotidyltransferase domain-containing protein [Bacteroidales bacterium]
MIKTIQDYFKTQPVLKAWVFGSYARNEETEDSDVDILVDLDYSQPVGLESVQMQLDLQSLLKKSIDLVSSRGVSKYIKPYIDTDKKVLYEC